MEQPGGTFPVCGLGQPEIAEGLFRDVLSDADLSARNRVFYQAQLSRTLTEAGDHTQAVSEALVVIPELEGTVRSARTVNILRPVRRQVPPDSEFAVRFDAIAS